MRRRLGTGIIALMLGGAALSGGCVNKGKVDRGEGIAGRDVAARVSVERHEEGQGGGGAVPGPNSGASCDDPYAMRWEQPRRNPSGYNPTVAFWGADDGMYVEVGASLSFETRIYRPDDGQEFEGWGEPLLGASGDFRRTISVTSARDRLVVRSLADGAEKLSVPLDSEARLLGVNVTPDASVVAALIWDGQDRVTSLRWWSLDDGGELGIAVIDGGEVGYDWNAHGFDLELSPDSRHALVVVPGRTDLHRFDLLSKVQTRWSDIHLDGAGVATEIIDVAISPDGDRLATTGTDGLLRLHAIDGPSGEIRPIAEPRPVGVFNINAMSFVDASPASPLAWSPDGRLLAFVDVEGRVRLLEDGELRPDALPAPSAEDERYADSFGDRPNYPLLIAFSHDGLSLGVSYDRSIASYGCGAAATVLEDALDVDISGPNVVDFDDPYVGHLTVDSHSPLVGVRLLAADHLHIGLDTNGDITFSASQLGRIEVAVEVEAFDGRATGRASTTVEFIGD